MQNGLQLRRAEEDREYDEMEQLLFTSIPEMYIEGRAMLELQDNDQHDDNTEFCVNEATVTRCYRKYQNRQKMEMST
jgi:hypothetical protein